MPPPTSDLSGAALQAAVEAAERAAPPLLASAQDLTALSEKLLPILTQPWAAPPDLTPALGAYSVRLYKKYASLRLERWRVQFPCLTIIDFC